MTPELNLIAYIATVNTIVLLIISYNIREILKHLRNK